MTLIMTKSIRLLAVSRAAARSIGAFWLNNAEDADINERSLKNYYSRRVCARMTSAASGYAVSNVLLDAISKSTNSKPGATVHPIKEYEESGAGAAANHAPALTVYCRC